MVFFYLIHEHPINTRYMNVMKVSDTVLKNDMTINYLGIKHENTISDCYLTVLILVVTCVVKSRLLGIYRVFCDSDPVLE